MPGPSVGNAELFWSGSFTPTANATLRLGTSPGVYSQSVSVPWPSTERLDVITPALAAGQWYAVLDATTPTGRSVRSNEVPFVYDGGAAGFTLTLGIR